MDEYSQNRSWAVNRIRFDYLGATYRGRGRLSWDPDRGFHLDGFLHRDGPPLPDTIEFGKLGNPDASAVCPVRMSLEGVGRARSPRLFLGESMELVYHNRLDTRFPCVLFTRPLPARGDEDRHCGGALFDVGKGLTLPDRLSIETAIGGRVVKQGISMNGLDYEDDSLKLLGCAQPEGPVRLDWVLKGNDWSKADAWNYGEGLATALSFLSGRTVSLLEREVHQGNRAYVERRKRGELVDLGILALPPRTTRRAERFPKGDLVRLGRFFTKGGQHADVCRRMLAQMAEACRHADTARTGATLR